jgi:hypothetical protein
VGGMGWLDASGRAFFFFFSFHDSGPFWDGKITAKHLTFHQTFPDPPLISLPVIL